MRTSGTVTAPSGEAGSHICWVFEGPCAFRRAAVEFLDGGVARNERLLYVADRPSLGALRDDLAGLGGVDRMLADGSLLLSRVRDASGPGGRFDGHLQLAAYAELVERALADGYAGLRVVADATALVRLEPERRRFMPYELGVDRLMAKAPMTALCAFDRWSLGPAITELCAVHPQRRVDPDLDPGFWLYHGAGGLCLEGEVDIANIDLFRMALEAAVRDTDEVVLDLAGLRFVDVRGLVALAGVADEVVAGGRRLRLNATPASVTRCCRILELDSLLLAVSQPAPIRGERPRSDPEEAGGVAAEDGLLSLW